MTFPNSPVLSWRDYLALPREAETWLISNLLPAGGAMVLYGDSKTGKSYAALQLALALSDEATGTWLGFPISQKGQVVYIQLDTPRSLWAARIDKLNIPDEKSARVQLCDRGTLDCWPFDILNPNHYRLLTQLVADVSPTAVIIDTIREAHSADEDSSTTMRNVISSLCAATQPAALILVAHSRKPNYQHGPDLLHDQRGSGYVVGRMDAIVRFTKKTLHYTGREIEEGTIRIERLDNGFWMPSRSEQDAHIATILSDPTLHTVSAQGRALFALLGGIDASTKSEEACRSIIRRLGKGVKS